jgi:hypothetical protein
VAPPSAADAAEQRTGGPPPETEVIDQALSFLLLREELVEGVARIAGSGGVSNCFEDDQEP